MRMNHALNAPTIAYGAVTGGVRRVLQSEGLAIFSAATAAYFVSGGNPWLFAVLFFAPDLSFAAYPLGTKAGALAYNAVHTYVLPVLLGGAGWLLGMSVLWQIALILAAHVGFDRSLGYGLKYTSAFKHTHLGLIGRQA